MTLPFQTQTQTQKKKKKKEKNISYLSLSLSLSLCGQNNERGCDDGFVAMKKSDFPALDWFICIVDLYKEPPIRLVSIALSVMAYDYPTEKILVYVSNDSASQHTLFACMEAAKFASHWLLFCRKTNIIDRSPEAYFASIRGN